MKIARFDIGAQKGFTPLCPHALPVPGGDEIAPALDCYADKIEAALDEMRTTAIQLLAALEETLTRR